MIWLWRVIRDVTIGTVAMCAVFIGGQLALGERQFSVPVGAFLLASLIISWLKAEIWDWPREER
ncbi:MAG: hypothetical protein AAF968_10175 [Pseudomonadota bacterium]